MIVTKEMLDQIEGYKRWNLPIPDELSVAAAIVTDNWHKKSCFQCSQEFYSKRSDTKYCSDNCRKSASRNKKKLISLKKDVLIKINVMSEIARFDDELKQIFLTALTEISNKCDRRRDDD